MKYMVETYQFGINCTSNYEVCHLCLVDKADDVPYAGWRDDVAWRQERGH